MIFWCLARSFSPPSLHTQEQIIHGLLNPSDLELILRLKQESVRPDTIALKSALDAQIFRSSYTP
jgi:hypothetical protein